MEFDRTLSRPLIGAGQKWAGPVAVLRDPAECGGGRSCSGWRRLMKYATAVPIGTGATGEVVRAWDPELERDVALKILRWDDPALARRMQREARLQAKVVHPNVCRVYEVGTTDDGRPFIAMEYVPGRPLDEIAEEVTREQLVEIMVRTAEAVHAAHAVGLVHRDLKPANVLVAEEHGRLEPKVLDFGIAREESGQQLTVTGQLLGTPGYVSPEQARGQLSSLDRRSDVFSLGAMLYRLLTGTNPFQGASAAETLAKVLECHPPAPRSVAPELPADLEAVIMRCLQAEPARRYQTALELADDLGRYLRGERVTARRVGWVSRTVWLARRHPITTGLAALLLVGFTVGSIKYAVDLTRSRERALAARDDAERMVEFILSDLYRELEPVGRLDVLQDAAEQVTAYYERFPGGALDEAQQIRRGIAHLNLCSVFASQGRIDRSIEAARTAIRLLEAPPGVNPSLERREALAEAHERLAESLLEDGRTDLSREHMRRSLAMRRDLLEENPDRPGLRAAVAAGLGELGWFAIENRDYAQSLELLGQARDILVDLARDAPADLMKRYRVAEVDSYLGRAHLESGDPEAAIERYHAALDRVQTLAAEEPNTMKWQFERMLLAGRIGWALEEMGDLDRALETYRSGLEVGDRLIEHDPDNALWLREVGVLHTAIAAILSERGALDGALDHATRSLQMSRTLAGRGDAHGSEANDLAWDLVQVGAIRAALGDRSGAREHWRRAVEVIEPVTREVRQSWYLDTHAMALLHLGRVEEARPLVRELLERGWAEPDFLALCRQHGLVGKERSVSP